MTSVRVYVYEVNVSSPRTDIIVPIVVYEPLLVSTRDEVIFGHDRTGQGERDEERCRFAAFPLPEPDSVSGLR